MWKNNEFVLNFKESDIREYERVVLNSGDCRHLFPMLFIGNATGQTAYYNCSGYVPLSTFRVEKTSDALFILEKTLLILAIVQEHLITPSRVMLTMDTVFFNRENGNIKIAYVPVTDETASVRRNVLSFIFQLRSEITDEHAAYLEEAARLITYSNYQLRDLINRIGSFKQDLYAASS